MNILELVGRKRPLFDTDVQAHEAELSAKVASSRFLVIGGKRVIEGFATSVGWWFRTVARPGSPTSGRTKQVAFRAAMSHGDDLLHVTAKGRRMFHVTRMPL